MVNGLRLVDKVKLSFVGSPFALFSPQVAKPRAKAHWFISFSNELAITDQIRLEGSCLNKMEQVLDGIEPATYQL